MTDRERRIRDLAYQIWEENGRPEGEGERHWSEAERRYAAEGGSTSPAKGAEAVKAEKEPKPSKTMAAAAAAGAPPKIAGKAAKVDPSSAAEPTAAKPAAGPGKSSGGKSGKSKSGSGKSGAGASADPGRKPASGAKGAKPKGK